MEYLFTRLDGLFSLGAGRRYSGWQVRRAVFHHSTIPLLHYSIRCIPNHRYSYNATNIKKIIIYQIAPVLTR